MVGRSILILGELGGPDEIGELDELNELDEQSGLDGTVELELSRRAFSNLGL